MRDAKYSVDDVASLLQLFFMDLPAPLIPPSVLTDLATADVPSDKDIAAAALADKKLTNVLSGFQSSGRAETSAAGCNTHLLHKK